jgi:hypothetical protein
MSEPRTRYGEEPLTPQRREAIRRALQAVIDWLQAAKGSIEEPRAIMFSDCDQMLEHLEAARLAIAKAQRVLE